MTNTTLCRWLPIHHDSPCCLSVLIQARDLGTKQEVMIRFRNDLFTRFIFLIGQIVRFFNDLGNSSVVTGILQGNQGVTTKRNEKGRTYKNPLKLFQLAYSRLWMSSFSLFSNRLSLLVWLHLLLLPFFFFGFSSTLTRNISLHLCFFFFRSLWTNKKMQRVSFLEQHSSSITSFLTQTSTYVKG